MPRKLMAGASLVTALLSGACELREVSLVDVEDVIVAEVYANLEQDPADNQVLAFLHRTVSSDDASVADLLAATITVSRSDGFELVLLNGPREQCVESVPDGTSGACFTSDPEDARMLMPGDLLELRIDFVTGETLEGASRLPGAFRLREMPATCRLPPDTLFPLSWSLSDGAWAYVNETSIRGLPEALRPEGIEVEDDPLYLLGLSVSDADTDIVFPSEFGVFNRFELDQDLSVRLQRGLPAGTVAAVTITAVERNYVNWARGGSFNPSGQVRIPSLRGEGTGVFAGSLGQRLVVVSSDDATLPLPSCPTT
jgi:hypothetical protein